MRTLYIECNMGAAGDMLMSALYELMDEEQKEEFLKRMNGLGLPGVRITPRKSSTCGISGTHMEVTVYGEEEHEPGEEHAGPHTDHHGHEHAELHADHHHHADPLHIAEVIGGLDLPEEVRDNAGKVYDAIADAEAKAHGCPVEQVHFHEVGALDAVADVTGVCYAIYLLRPERIVASPVHVGSGTVTCWRMCRCTAEISAENCVHLQVLHCLYILRTASTICRSCRKRVWASAWERRNLNRQTV